MSIGRLLAGFAASGEFMMFEELMDHSGRKMAERMEREGKLHYDKLDVHERINFKALITLDRPYVSALSHRMDLEEFEILGLIKTCSGSWRATINIMLDKWQNIIEKKDKNETGDNGNGVRESENPDQGVAR